jgi:hypothetical protein
MNNRSIALPFDPSCWAVVVVIVVVVVVVVVRAELHLSGLMGTASHPVMQKIGIIGFFFENRLHWQFEVENKVFKRLY